MYSTSVNYYIPRQTVVLYSTALSTFRSYNIVYSKNLKLHKGADNKIQFQFLNQEQKPVNITGKTITCRLMKYDASEIMLQKSLTPLYPVTGLVTLEVTRSELSEIEGQLCYYSLTIADAGLNLPVFVDHASAVRGVVEIVDGIIPKHLLSDVITIPDHAAPEDNIPVTFYSNEFTTPDNPFLTVQTQLTDYQGTIQIQGSVLGDSDWYNITDALEYDGYTNTEYQNIEGIHPFIRLEFISEAGTVNDILVR